MATEVDDDSTIVGGYTALIEAVLASPVLEARALADDARYEDSINT